VDADRRALVHKSIEIFKEHDTHSDYAKIRKASGNLAWAKAGNKFGQPACLIRHRIRQPSKVFELRRRDRQFNSFILNYTMS
jgi:hypothetical protein